MSKNVKILILMIFCYSNGEAQYKHFQPFNFDKADNIKYLDSLASEGKNQWAIIKDYPRSLRNDTTKLHTLYALSTVYQNWFGKRDSLMLYANQLISLAKTFKNNDYYLKGLFKTEFFYRVARVNYQKAVEINMNILKILNESSENYQPLEWRVNYNLGAIYKDLKEYKKSLGYYSEALKFYRLDKNSFASVAYYSSILQELGIANRELLNFKESEKYFEEALAALETKGVLSNYGYIYQDLGTLYLKKQDNKNALLYLEKAEAIFEKAKRKRQVNQIWSIKIQVLYQMGEYDKAFDLAQKVAGTTFNRTNVMEALKIMTNVYERRGDFKRALQTYKLYVISEDSAKISEKTRAITEIQAKFEQEKIESQNLKELQRQQAIAADLEKQAEIFKVKSELEKKILLQKNLSLATLSKSENDRLASEAKELQASQTLIINNLKIKDLSQSIALQNQTKKYLIIIILVIMALGIILFFLLYRQSQQKLKFQTITSGFQQKIAETEITALRSQMNPHFIFNCLNSIKLYSLENDSHSASDYLTKFSRLIRLVLENSRSEKVTLENELETLKLYIEMEAMRFKDKVKYQINIAPYIDQQFIEIPPLLIQPFVENSIWHGLMHKSEGGTVKIDVSQPKEQVLHIEISDDGIGREKAQAYKSKSAMKQKSFGMKVTSERIELINQIYKTNTEVEIIDLKDQNGELIGTKVMLNIPI